MKQLLILLFLCAGNTLIAQNVKHIQEAMNSYDYEKAIQLIEKEKPTTELLFQKGKALQALSYNIEALETFRQIIATDTLNQRAFIEVAECCKQMGKYQDALKYYQKAIDINPHNKYVRIQYISLLCNLQQYEEAFGESSVLAETDSSAVVLLCRLKVSKEEPDILMLLSDVTMSFRINIRMITWLLPNWAKYIIRCKRMNMPLKQRKNTAKQIQPIL